MRRLLRISGLAIKGAVPSVAMAKMAYFPGRNETAFSGGFPTEGGELGVSTLLGAAVGRFTIGDPVNLLRPLAAHPLMA